MILHGQLINFNKLMKLFPEWSKWQNIGVVYNSTEYVYTLLQYRINSKGKVQFAHRKIQKYGSLTQETIEKINTTCLPN